VGTDHLRRRLNLPSADTGIHSLIPLVCLALLGAPTYNIEVKRVIDGDTLEVDVYLGLSVHKIEKVRLLCVDTPERAAGKEAVAFVKEWVAANHSVVLHVRRDNDRDVYGRLLAVVCSADSSKSLNQALLDAKLAVVFMCDHG
jgi:micrococcal nuclease